MRRSGVPKSVNMLDQLHFFRDKTFPGRRFSFDWRFRDGHHPHLHHKHPPLSARPLRPQRQAPLLNRPKTSATLYRKNIEDETTNVETNGNRMEEPSLMTNYDILIDSNGRHVADMKNKTDPATANQSRFDQDYRQSTELPPIKIKENKENIQPLNNLKDNLNLPRDVQSSSLSKMELEKELKMVSQGIDKTNRLIDNLPSQLLKNSESTTSLRQRRESASSLRGTLDNKNITLTRVDSFIESVPQTEMNKDVNNNQLSETDPLSPILTDEDNEKEIKNIRVNDFVEKHALQDFQKQQQQQQQQQHNKNQPCPENGVSQFNDNKPMECAVDWQDPEYYNDTITNNDPAEAKPQKRLIRQNTKTNFNRIVNEPAPLRHNITSVLRQERTRYEASQKKVKDYLHTISSKDGSSKHSNSVSREPSAHSSRRSAAGRKTDESKSDTKYLRKSIGS